MQLYAVLAALYAVAMIPTHLAIKYMEFEMPRWKRVVALALWPWFIVLLVFLDIFRDAIKSASK